MDKVTGLYNEHHLYYLYDWMLKNSQDSVIDIAGSTWYKDELKQILIEDYGYKAVQV